MRILLLSVLASTLSAQTPELRVTAADRTALSITIYQNGLAVVRDTRRASLPAGLSRLAFADVAASIRPKSAYLLDTGQGVEVIERNFEFNLLGSGSLGVASMGQPAAARDAVTGDMVWGMQASVPWPKGLRAPRSKTMPWRPGPFLIQPTDSVLIRTSDGYEVARPPLLTYQRVPPTLRSTPTLIQTLDATAEGPRDLCLLYTAEELSWEAHYIATLSADASRLDLDAFATVENRSGIDYPAAVFQLVAGEPNVVEDPAEQNEDPTEAESTVMVVASAIPGPPVFREERLSEYPIFTLDRPTTVLDRQRKQLALFESKGLPVAINALVTLENYWFNLEGDYLASCLDQEGPARAGASPIPLSINLSNPERLTPFDEAALDNDSSVKTWLSCHRPPVTLEGTIRNDKANHLGRALPAGSLDLRYQTPEGACISMGSSEVDSTPSGEPLRIQLGQARGFSAERNTLSMRRLGSGDKAAWELELAVTVTNRTSRTMETVLREPVFKDWTLVRANLKGRRSGENAYDFDYISRPHSSFTLRYRVKTSPVELPEPS